MTAKAFINDFLSNLEGIIANHPYYSFIVLCSCIEFLGQCLDDDHSFNETTERGMSKDHFNSGLSLFTDTKYKSLNLYDQLRCGMVHAALPKSGIWLCQNHNAPGGHLRTFKKRKIMNIDQLLIDLKAACKIITDRIDSGVYFKHPKMTEDILTFKT